MRSGAASSNGSARPLNEWRRFPFFPLSFFLLRPVFVVLVPLVLPSPPHQPQLMTCWSETPFAGWAEEGCSTKLFFPMAERHPESPRAAQENKRHGLTHEKVQISQRLGTQLGQSAGRRERAWELSVRMI